MLGERNAVGLALATVGAAVLLLSVFLPWYGVSVTAAGASAARPEIAAVAEEYGNTTLQARLSNAGARIGSLAGVQLATVSAHEVLKRLWPVLIFLAAITLLASLFLLGGLVSLIDSTGRQIALLGVAAGGVVAFRMYSPPTTDGNLISLSLRFGSYLALLSAVAIVAGGLLAGSRPPSRRARLGYIPHA